MSWHVCSNSSAASVCVCVCEVIIFVMHVVRDDCVGCAGKRRVSEFKMIVFLRSCVRRNYSGLVCKIAIFGSFYFPPLARNPFLSRRLILPLITI